MSGMLIQAFSTLELFTALARSNKNWSCLWNRFWAGYLSLFFVYVMYRSVLSASL